MLKWKAFVVYFLAPLNLIGEQEREQGRTRRETIKGRGDV